MAAQYLASDPHSPSEFPCNVVASNIAEFYEAFPDAAEAPDAVAEADRVVIW